MLWLITALLRAVGGAGSGSDLLRNLSGCGHMGNTGCIGHDKVLQYLHMELCSVWKYQFIIRILETINKSFAIKRKQLHSHCPTSGVLINSFGKMINSSNMAIKLALVQQF